MSTPNKLTAINNGPQVFEGNFRIKGVDGNVLASADKVYLCRCGKSGNKPFCDGTHKK
jgi:CDGSH-type Zn-finger protein